MTVLEMKVEALLRCVDQDKLEAAITELNGAAFIKNNVPSEIRFHLANIGMPAHVRGHRYLVYVIERVVSDENLIDVVTGELYPEAAKHFNTAPYCVERAIRHAIEIAWDRGDIDSLQSYFGNTISREKGKPTNSEFIAQLANIVRDQMR